MTAGALAAGALAAALLVPGGVRAETVASVEPPASAPAAKAAPAASPEPAPRLDPKPDPAALDVGEANLESLATRKGLIFTFAFGGSVSVGLGMKNATGRGGAGTLRLAHVASPRTVLAVEIVGSALFFSVSKEAYRTDAQSFMLAGQLYVNPALWLRGAVGIGRYAGEELKIDVMVGDQVEEKILRDRIRLAGPAASAGAGVDVLRYKRFRASLEVCSTAMLNRDGILSSNAFLIGLSLD